MAQTFLLFDFGTSEEAAQQARHTLERWKQSFRLDKKLLLKFDREQAAEPPNDESGNTAKGAKKEKVESKDEPIKIIVRLDFSDHEKLSHQRWVERISGDQALKEANPKVVRRGDADFETTSRRFETLE